MDINDTKSVAFFISQAVIRSVEEHQMERPKTVKQLEETIDEVANCTFGIDNIEKENKEAFEKIVGNTSFLISGRLK